jgi:hypothetical protein
VLTSSSVILLLPLFTETRFIKVTQIYDLADNAPRSHYGSKVPVVTVTVFKYRNKIDKIFVKAVPYSVT